MTRKRKTQEQFLDELNSIHGNEITTEDRYLGDSIKLTFHCNMKLGHPDWKNTPSHILGGQGCPICKRALRDKKRTKTQDEFKKDLYNVHGNSISTDDNYYNSHTSITFHCNAGLGHKDWKTTPGVILHGSGCPECGNIRMARANSISDTDFRHRLRNVHGNNITTNEKYVGNTTKLTFHCNKGLHHKDWKMAPRDVLSGSGCPECGEIARITKLKKSNIEFTQEISETTGNTIIPLEKYKGARTSIKVSCALCSHIWKASPTNLLRGRGCPNCKSSAGEKMVRTILEFNGINYDPQYNFKIKGKTHRLDIVLKDTNSTWCVIQPDGIQHFKPNNHMGGEKEFEHRKQMDRDENKYLSALGVRVLRIPWFWCDLDNIFILLQEFLSINLDKPNKSDIPGYKKIKDIVYEYLAEGTTRTITTKYKISTSHLFVIFKQYFGMSREEYIKVHPEYKPSIGASSCVVSIDEKGKRTVYKSQGEARRVTGAKNISNCIRGIRKHSGGLRWEHFNKDIDTLD